LIHGEGICFNPYGILELWNIGNQKRMMVQFYVLICAIFVKKDLIPLDPAFQLSSIPSLH